MWSCKISELEVTAGLMPVRPHIVALSDIEIPEGAALQFWKE